MLIQSRGRAVWVWGVLGVVLLGFFTRIGGKVIFLFV